MTKYALTKYGFVFGIGIQNTLVYRFNFLMRALIALVPLSATLFLWQSIYSGKSEGSLIGAYSLPQMMSYYLLVTVVDAFTAVAEDDWQIAADIRNGQISQFLLKPMDFFAYRICLYFSGRCIYTVMALIPVAGFIAFQHQYFVLPSGIGAWIGFGISCLLAGLLQFLIAYCVALMAFWLLDVSTLIFMQFAIEYLVSGHLFPLDLLPGKLVSVMNCLPYPYLLHFPISIYLERLSRAEIARGFAFQIGWIVIMTGLARWVWNRGIRHYEAVGG